jgi:uncharacterized protein with FMN-binding domain
MARGGEVGGSLPRALVLAGGTAAGLILVLSYRTPVATHDLPALAQSSAAPGSASARQGSGGTSRSADTTVTGAVVNTQYGPVQVQVTVANGSWVDVQAISLPSGDPTSARISDFAAPQLRQQALAAQSASLDGVAGASYTSEGYRQSLQSALSQLG